MTQYFVDPAGSDAAAGTSTGTAWQTLGKVNGSSFSASDQILLKRGGVWREILNMPSSGSAGNPIVIGAYGSGADPIISAADILGTSGWSASSPSATVFVDDNFTRADQAGWGTAGAGADSSLAWTVDATNLAIASNHGVMSKNFGGEFVTVGDSHSQDVDIYVEMHNVTTSEDNHGGGLQARVTAGTTGYGAFYERSTGTFRIKNTHLNTVLASGAIADPGADRKMRMQVITQGNGSVTINARVWAFAAGEPGTWDLTINDNVSKYTTGQVGWGGYNSSGSSDLYLTRFTAQTVTVAYTATYQKSVATDPGYILIEDGVLLTHVTSVPTVESTPASFYWAAGVLYVHATGGGTPASNGKVYEAAKRAYGIDINAKSYITITGNITAEGTTFDGNNAGIHIQNGSDNITVDQAVGRRNNVWGIVAIADGGTTPTNITFRNFDVYENQGYGGIGGNVNTMFLIEDGASHDNGNPQDTGTSGPWHDHGIYATSNGNGIVRRCRVYNNRYGGGCSSGSGSTGVKWSYIQSWGNQFDIFLHEGSSGDELYHITGDASDVSLQIGVDSGAATTPTAIKNCVFANGVTGGVRVGSGGSGVGAAFTNNDVKSAGTDYIGVSSQTGSNGNISSDPLFVSAAGHDYRLTRPSPAKNTGVLVSGIGQTVNGIPDMGAIESPADGLALGGVGA